MNRAIVLVLAQLALAGCGKKSTLDPPGAHRDCASSKDCDDGRNTWCMKVGDASTGKCYPEPREGRPLAIDGTVHVAPFVPRAGAKGAPAGGELARLRAAAQDEHASIAAFARTIAELMALGAPLWLLAETREALGDEIRHTERTLAVLERLTGERPTLGRLEAATRPVARSVEELFRDVLRGGAVGETLAATTAELRRSRGTYDVACDEALAELAELDEMIVVDESRHAALAFKTLRWLSEQAPHLRAIVDEEWRDLDPSAQTLLAPLFEAALDTTTLAGARIS